MTRRFRRTTAMQPASSDIPSPGSGQNPQERVQSVSDYLAGELTIEWNKKSSLEARALACLTVNLAVSTLALAVQARLRETSHPNDEHALFVIMIVAASIAAASILCAIMAAVPYGYLSPNAELLEELQQGALDGSRRVDAEVMIIRKLQLRRARDRNHVKATWLIWSYASVALFAALMVIGLVMVASPPV